MSGLLRHTEGPDFKKAALVAVVTAGTGALVYSGYRYWQHSKLDKPSKEITPIEKETTTLSKKEITTPAASLSPKPKETVVLELPKSPKFGVTDELSTSGTFEKISLGKNNEADSFEHITMSNVQSDQSTAELPPQATRPPNVAESFEQKNISSELSKEVDQSFSLLTMSQIEEPSLSSSSFVTEAGNEPSLASSFVTEAVNEPSLTSSFVTEAAEEPSLVASYVTETESTPPIIVGGDAEEPENQTFDSQVLAVFEEGDLPVERTEPAVNVKDENDIIVIEKADSGAGDGNAGQQSGALGVAVHDFDPSRVSPVFGGAAYHPIEVDEEALSAFDSSVSHPASIGYEFEKEE